jgi:hypothetical protein
MKSTLLYVSLAVFCFTQLFLGAVVADIPAALLGSIVPAGFGLLECIVKNGLASVTGTDLIKAQGGSIQTPDASGATSALGSLPVADLLKGVPIAGPLLGGILGGLLNTVTGLVGGLLGGLGGLGGVSSGSSGVSLPLVGNILGTSGNPVDGLPIVGGVVNGLPVVGPLVGAVSSLVFGTVVGLVGGVLATVSGVLYCIVGPNGLVAGVINSVGQVQDGVLKGVVPS